MRIDAERAHLRSHAELGVYGGSIVENDIGEAFSILDEAAAHAAVVVDELGHNNIRRIVVTVLDAGGRLAKVP